MGALRHAAFALSLLVLFPAAVPSAVAQPAPSAASTVDAEATVLHLTERAERTLRRDRLVAELDASAVDADPKRLQAEINRRMAAAVARAKEVSSINLQTTGYSVYREQPQKGPARWVGREGLRLAGGDFAVLLDLVGALQQQGLTMSRLAADLSPEAVRSVEDDLTAEALARLKQRAGRIAAALGTRVERYRDLQVGNASTPPPAMAMRAMSAMAPMPASAPPPTAEPGDATVSVVVNASVLLAPARQ
jgi:predicted secreted protein